MTLYCGEGLNRICLLSNPIEYQSNVFKLIIEFAKCDNFILQFILYLDKIKKEEMCIGQQQKSISWMKIYTHKINPRLDQMHGPLHYKEKTNIKKLD